jgi:hypothetical protein
LTSYYCSGASTCVVRVGNGGACNTTYYGGCCPGTNLVCYTNKCIKLFPDAKSYEE